MRQFEMEQAANCEIEWREREPWKAAGFLNWNPTYDQQKFKSGMPTQSVFPREFQAHQEDDISFWVENGQQFLTHPIAESKISRPSMWSTQSVRHVMYRERFQERHVISNAFPALEDNTFLNHMFSWATSRYEDRLIRFILKARFDALLSPEKINSWTRDATKSRCPFCGEIGASLRYMQCNAAATNAANTH
jgi:hypothetical protein